MTDNEAAAYHYVKLGGARDRIARALAETFGDLGRVLDVGTGEGLFALALAATGAPRSVLGIDPHAGRITNARWLAERARFPVSCRFEKATFTETTGKFDSITLFLALTDVLREQELEPFLRSLADSLTANGRLVLCVGFPELAESAQERLGYALHRAVGYQFPSLADIKGALHACGLQVIYRRDDSTDAPLIGTEAMLDFLRRENGYEVEGGGPERDVGSMWHDLAADVAAAQQCARLDARIDTLVACKK